VEFAGENAFSGTPNHFRITWHYNSALNGCRNILPYLEEVIIPNHITGIPADAFKNAGFLSIVRFAGLNNNILQSIGDRVFENTRISEIDIPSSVRTIGQYAFNDTPLWNNTAANSIVYADRWAVGVNGTAFELNLKNDTIGIADSAFRNQMWRRDIVIPYNVKYIGYFAFFHVPLRTISIKRPSSSGITTLSNNAITASGFVSNALRIYVPCQASAAAYIAAPNWSAFWQIIQAGTAAGDFTVNIFDNTWGIPGCIEIFFMMPAPIEIPVLFDIEVWAGWGSMRIGSTQIMLEPDTMTTVNLGGINVSVMYFSHSGHVLAHTCCCNGIGLLISAYVRPADLPPWR